MPPLHSRATRLLVRERNKIEGPRSLHRGIHLNLNDSAARGFKARGRTSSASTATAASSPAAAGGTRSTSTGVIGTGRGAASASAAAPAEKSHRDLLVHHQKIKADLEDLYLRTSNLHKDNLTMEERIEESWLAFARVGGRVPVKVGTAIANARAAKDKSTLLKAEYGTNRGSTSAALCVAPGAIPYAERLRQLSADKKELQGKAAWERTTRGEAVDYGEGSALHSMKDRRIRNFQQRQLARAHKLRRYGDPTPLKQSGKFDDQSATFRVFNKTIRSVQREVAHDARVSAVKEPRRRKRARTEDGGSSGGSSSGGGFKSQWDVRGTGNVNRPDSEMLRYSRDWEVGPAHGGKRGGGGKKRGRS